MLFDYLTSNNNKKIYDYFNLIIISIFLRDKDENVVALHDVSNITMRKTCRG